MNKRKKIFIYKCLLILITYSIVEFACFVSIQSGYITARKPTFDFVLKDPKYPIIFADINPIWGTWHYKDHYKAQIGCLYIDYQINSYGARDKERTKKSTDPDRVIVLGDSFIEGFGVQVENRLSDLLEKKTRHEFLNFGCADFGTTQEYLIYEHLAKGFEHSTVLIGMLPFNDFENDDILYSEPTRYKPYFVKYDTTYKLEYHADALEKSTFNKEKYHSLSKSFKTVVSRFLRSYTYWFNIIDFIKDKKLRQYANKNKEGLIFSYYYDFNHEHLDRLKFILSRLRLSAPYKRIILFTIPMLPDFMRYQKSGKPPLAADLKNICDSLDMEYLDLLPPLFQKEKDYRKYSLPCDLHWNELAHKSAADVLINYLHQ